MADTIEGKNPVLEALKAGRPLNKILLAKNIRKDTVVTEILSYARNKRIPVEFIDRYSLERRGLTGASQGILAYTAAREYITLDELMAIPSEKGEPALYCVLDGLEDPMNLGAILRTAEAAGVHGIIIRSRRAVGLTSIVAKASAGAIEYMPVARVANITRTLETLKKNSIWIIGIDMSAETEYTRVDFKLPVAIVIGSEGKGLSPLVRKSCDSTAFIPMKGKINSLNASVAAALVMYEALRQRSE
jgi:23S rRNA (guanosine2251-2'-O)-methyltransferase